MTVKKSALACSVCSSRNYLITAKKHQSIARLEVKKFCKYCGQYTIHRETK
ncbi:MAG: 50S ribosomal protein L33 [Lactobacillales bacterium]|nr:50S ribosomal protein L33 [Lactobacillales bacterium]